MKLRDCPIRNVRLLSGGPRSVQETAEVVKGMAAHRSLAKAVAATWWGFVLRENRKLRE